MSQFEAVSQTTSLLKNKQTNKSNHYGCVRTTRMQYILLSSMVISSLSVSLIPTSSLEPHKFFGSHPDFTVLKIKFC